LCTVEALHRVTTNPHDPIVSVCENGSDPDDELNIDNRYHVYRYNFNDEVNGDFDHEDEAATPWVKERMCGRDWDGRLGAR
jgi:hypothetical protein